MSFFQFLRKFIQIICFGLSLFNFLGIVVMISEKDISGIIIYLVLFAITIAISWKVFKFIFSIIKILLSSLSTITSKNHTDNFQPQKNNFEKQNNKIIDNHIEESENIDQYLDKVANDIVSVKINYNKPKKWINGFIVAGTSYRQAEIKQLTNNKPNKYRGLLFDKTELKKTTFNDEVAIEVWITEKKKKKMIGYVPKDKIDEIKMYVDNDNFEFESKLRISKKDNSTIGVKVNIREK